nr:rho GTPase-activating protein 10 [Peromyscus maniculatus bairdii]
MTVMNFPARICCISSKPGLSAAQRKFAHSLRDFKFEFIGDAETDDERCIDASLREFSNFLKNLEEQREIMALSVTETLIKPLEKFRKEQLGAVKEEKKKFDKETEKNYSLIDKHLTLSAKKKDSHLQEVFFSCAQLDTMGFTILRKCISAVETRGINDQGLYRVVGVSSKVQRLLSMLMDAKTCNELDLENSLDWEVKTVTSALKQYLRSLPEPLMTYELHRDFIVPAKSGSPESRVNAIHFLVHKLPEKNKEMLDILVKHLTNVSNHSKQNLMTVANLGVVFGPTLMRPQEETVAAIMDLKFQNIVVEILIENHEKIFRTSPDTAFPEPTCLSASPPNAPPRQSKRQGQRTKRPVAVYNLCLELEDGDNPGPLKEDTPTSSQDSLSTPSPTTSTAHGPSGPDRNHLAAEGGNCGDWTATTPSHSRASTVPWLNLQSPTTPSSNPEGTSPSPRMSHLPLSPAASVVDKLPECVINRKARAVYPCEAEHSSELSFEIGAIFEDVQTSREPGWLEGTLNGKRGLIPQNYVKLL